MNTSCSLKLQCCSYSTSQLFTLAVAFGQQSEQCNIQAACVSAVGSLPAQRMEESSLLLLL